MTPTILLLDLCPNRDLSDQLRQILEPTFSVSTAIPLDAGINFGERVDNQLVASAAVGNRLIFPILASPLSGLDSLFRAIREVNRDAILIPVVERAEAFELFELLKRGAADYITLPLRAVNILPRVWRLLESLSPPQSTTQVIKERLGLRQLVGKSAVFQREMEKIPIVAKCGASVLISGETGTGKELYARAIHYLSLRSSKPLIPVNCGAMPSELIEDELFGHERGAFTGATSSVGGLLQEAEGGTVFLDEIDCLPLPAQSKLLRFLQEKEYRPLGSTKVRKADVRVIAASNADFDEAIATEKIRRDLYYRLNVIRLVLPPLRERRDDIALLIQHFLEKYANEFGKKTPAISAELIEMLTLQDWPGNVRELEHTIERAVVLCQNGTISAEDISLPRAALIDPPETFQSAKAVVIEQFEKAYIQKLLLAYHGNITQAARAARKNRRAFWELIRKHRIEARTFKMSES